MPVKPASEMDDDTFRKHLTARHAHLADHLRRLDAMSKAHKSVSDAEALRGLRTLHRHEHGDAPPPKAADYNWTPHEHSA